MKDERDFGEFNLVLCIIAILIGIAGLGTALKNRQDLKQTQQYIIEIVEKPVQP